MLRVNLKNLKNVYLYNIISIVSNVYVFFQMHQLLFQMHNVHSAHTHTHTQKTRITHMFFKPGVVSLRAAGRQKWWKSTSNVMKQYLKVITRAMWKVLWFSVRTHVGCLCWRSSVVGPRSSCWTVWRKERGKTFPSRGVYVTVGWWT